MAHGEISGDAARDRETDSESDTAAARISILPIRNIGMLVRGIDEQMAKRFGHNPYVIAWQIDNEYNFVSYDDEHIGKQFQNWLKAKIRDARRINRRLVMRRTGARRIRTGTRFPFRLRMEILD